MTEIAIDGMIGCDTGAKDLRQALASASGDVVLTVNSPGGVVTEGIAMYNAIRDYRRKNKGTVTARVVGLAASMATYVPLAADRVEIEDNAVWMIHNPWGFAVGDYNDMRKTSEILDGLARILAAAYVAKTGKDADEIRRMMDSETYLYGDEIEGAGFADAVIEVESDDDKAAAVALARTRVGEVQKRLQELGEAADDSVALVAMIRALQPGEPPKDDDEKKRGVAVHSPAAAAEKLKQEGAMDIKALEKEHPDVFAAARELGVQDERKRVAALRSYIEADEHNEKVRAVVEEAIGSGKTAAEINAKLQVAIRDGGKLAGENPPAINAAHESGPVLTEEERSMCKALGLSEADYIKYGREGK